MENIKIIESISKRENGEIEAIKKGSSQKIVLQKETVKDEPGKKDKPKRKPTEYNTHMSIEIKKVKDENPGVSHKDAFRIAASRWKKVEKSEKPKDLLDSDGKAKKPRKPRKTKEEKEKEGIKQKRQPCEYNMYVKDRLSVVKMENPTMKHREAFKIVANEWSANKIKLLEQTSSLDKIAA